jgi:hypothetical protein
MLADAPGAFVAYLRVKGRLTHTGQSMSPPLRDLAGHRYGGD